jgi:hypothetical protein
MKMYGPMKYLFDIYEYSKMNVDSIFLQRKVLVSMSLVISISLICKCEKNTYFLCYGS